MKSKQRQGRGGHWWLLGKREERRIESAHEPKGIEGTVTVSREVLLRSTQKKGHQLPGRPSYSKPEVV
jgi:hypothetical protein